MARLWDTFAVQDQLVALSAAIDAEKIIFRKPLPPTRKVPAAHPRCARHTPAPPARGIGTGHAQTCDAYGQHRCTASTSTC